MELKLLDTENFDLVYKIFEESFPPDEMRSYSGQKSLLQKDFYKIYVLQDVEIKAFIAIYELGEITFIEHFAVSSACRNQGLGAKILKEIMGDKTKIYCLEVEPPLTEIAKRRIGFYRRNGFFYNDFYYVQPSLGEGRNPIELKIMSSGKELCENEFRLIKELIYKKVYGI